MEEAIPEGRRSALKRRAASCRTSSMIVEVASRSRCRMQKHCGKPSSGISGMSMARRCQRESVQRWDAYDVNFTEGNRGNTHHQLHFVIWPVPCLPT
jgi:hypothetical protein